MWRGHRVRKANYDNMIEYFRSIGRLDLTMSNEEKTQHDALTSVAFKLKIYVIRWRARIRRKKLNRLIWKAWKGFSTRELYDFLPKC